MEYYQRRSAREHFEPVTRPYAEHMVWVHVPDKKVDIGQLAETYGLDGNVVRDVYDRHELPRLEYKQGVQYTFIRTPSGANTQSDATVPLLIIIKQGHFFTISPYAPVTPARITQFLATQTDRPAALAVATMAAVVAEYETRVNTLEEKIAGARKRLRSHEVKNADFVEFVTIGDRLSEYGSSLESLAGIAQHLLANRHQLFTARDLEAIEDLALHTKQLLASISASSTTIASIQGAYSTIANNILNQRMKALTVITVLLAIPNVFYGMYGMNVKLPLQGEPWAYPAITGGTLLLILLVYILAKRYRLF